MPGNRGVKLAACDVSRQFDDHHPVWLHTHVGILYKHDGGEGDDGPGLQVACARRRRVDTHTAGAGLA